MWHFSVAVVGPSAAPILLTSWTHDDIVMAAALVGEYLYGIGDRERTHLERGDFALHVRRPLRPEEAIGLPRRRGAPVFPIERAEWG